MYLTRQEMFNRAVIGLYSQNWQHSFENGVCVYASKDGKIHCAWGWVDPSLDNDDAGTVSDMYDYKESTKQLLRLTDKIFADDLQQAHDNSIHGARDYNNLSLEQSMREFGKKYNLTWPLDTVESEIGRRMF